MLTRRGEFGGFPLRNFRNFAGYAEPFEELRRELDRLFFDFERTAPAPFQNGGAALSVTDEGSQYVLRADLPGVAEKDIELTVTGNTVTLKAERKVEPPAGHSVHRSERRGFRFARSYELPVRVDAEKVRADLKHGVLTVTLPKPAEVQPKQINVKAS